MQRDFRYMILHIKLLDDVCSLRLLLKGAAILINPKGMAVYGGDSRAFVRLLP